MRELNRKEETIRRNCKVAFLSFEAAGDFSKHKSQGGNHKSQTNINTSNLTLLKYIHTKKITINTIDKSLLEQFGAGHRWRLLSGEIQQGWINYKQETRRWNRGLHTRRESSGVGTGTEEASTEQGSFSLLLLQWWTLTRCHLGEERPIELTFPVTIHHRGKSGQGLEAGIWR